MGPVGRRFSSAPVVRARFWVVLAMRLFAGRSRREVRVGFQAAWSNMTSTADPRRVLLAGASVILRCPVLAAPILRPFPAHFEATSCLAPVREPTETPLARLAVFFSGRDAQRRQMRNWGGSAPTSRSQASFTCITTSLMWIRYVSKVAPLPPHSLLEVSLPINS